MKLFILACFLIFLTGCDSAPKTGPDGYKFGEKQYTQTELKINVVLYPDRKAFEKEVTRRKIKAENVAAFSILYVGDPTRCTIHMVDSAAEYAPEFVGHEFLHCVHGQWHTNNDKRS